MHHARRNSMLMHQNGRASSIDPHRRPQPRELPCKNAPSDPSDQKGIHARRPGPLASKPKARAVPAPSHEHAIRHTAAGSLETPPWPPPSARAKKASRDADERPRVMWGERVKSSSRGADLGSGLGFGVKGFDCGSAAPAPLTSTGLPWQPRGPFGVRHGRILATKTYGIALHVDRAISLNL